MNEQLIWDCLKACGMTDAGAAGMMGNLLAESGLRFNRLEELCRHRLKTHTGIVYTDESYTEAVDSGAITEEGFLHPIPGRQYGYGLCQWTSPGRKQKLYELCKSNGVSIGDSDAQLEFLAYELATSYKGVSDVLCSTDSVLDASTAVLKHFEQPADSDSMISTRYNYSKKYYDMFHGGGSKVTYYIANCGGDENGQLHGGQAGDQTGTEWGIKPITDYHAAFGYRLHHPNADVRRAIANLAVEAANNDLIGYDMDQRTTFYWHLSASNWHPAQITIPCESDCSSGVAALVIAAGHILGIASLAAVSPDMYTGNEVEILTAAGFEVTTDHVTDYARAYRGDIFLNCSDTGHHTAVYVGTNPDGSESAQGGKIMFEFSTVKPGDKGVDVLLLQEILKSRINPMTSKPFYEGPLDMIYDHGMGLESGVNAYQDQREAAGSHIGTNGEHDSICGRAMWQDLLGKASA